MRDRLIELIQDSVNGYARHWAEIIADYLLANGVIAPPCKVGDIVYSLMGGFPEEMKVNRLMLTLKPNNEYPLDFIREFDDFGKTVFLTKEEAEKALKEREG